MNDRPAAPELIAAARRFLEAELIPTLGDARLRFQTLIAANVLAIVERELSLEEEHLSQEWAGLSELLNRPAPPPSLSVLRQAVRDANAELCQRIRRGEFDDPTRFQSLARQLRHVVERKLQVANPRYLAGFTQGT
jgi:hypothetical protein